MLFYRLVAYMISRIKKQYGYFPKNNLRILCYHSVSDVIENSLYPKSNITMKQFNDQMNILKINQFKCLDFEKLESFLKGKCDIPIKSFIITFDDGFKNTLNNALPILEKYDYSCIIFITTDYIGERKKFNFIDWEPYKAREGGKKIDRLDNNFMPLSIKDIEILANKENVIIGSHGCSHENLTKIDEHKIRHELVDSKMILRDIVKKPVNHFAMPFGEFTKKTFKTILKEYSFIYGTRKGFVEKGMSSKRPLYRHSIHSNNNVTEFETQIFGGYDNFIIVKNFINGF